MNDDDKFFTPYESRTLAEMTRIGDYLCLMDNRLHFKTLNKREQIAATLLTGLLARGDVYLESGIDYHVQYAREAILYADALIVELNIQVKEV